MLFLSVLTFFVSLCAATGFVPPKTWTNERVERTIDLQRAYVAERWSFEVKNLDSTPNSVYYLAVPAQIWENLSLFSVFPENANEVLPTELLQETADSLIQYIKVTLPPVSPKSTFKFTVTMSITDSLQPLPKVLKMTDEQTLLLQTSKTPVCAYDTNKYDLRVVNVVEGTELDQIHGQEITERGVVKDNALTYSFDKVDAFTMKPLHLLYKHNAPLPKINNLKRGVWVSHWGATVQFVEDYEVTNEAAELETGFSRYDYMQIKNARQGHAMATMQLQLEPEASDIYFTDLVGNVSTSRVFRDNLYIKPRYPVFGGWHYNFTIGWTNTLSSYLKDLGSGEYIVSVPLLNGPQEVSYENVELSFYLPEGSEVLEVSCPIGYQELIQGNELSYFDLSNGHTKVTLTFKNVVDQVGKFEVLVKYKYGFNEWMTKPLNLAKWIFVALLSYLALTKVDIALKAKK